VNSEKFEGHGPFGPLWLRLWLVCHAKRVNIKMAIIMAAMITSCSTAMLAAKKA